MKTLLAIITAIASLFTPLTPAKTGDVNNDGRVNTQDVLIIHQYCIGEKTLTKKQLKAADCNKDGVVNSEDTLWILENDDVTN